MTHFLSALRRAQVGFDQKTILRKDAPRLSPIKWRHGGAVRFFEMLLLNRGCPAENGLRLAITIKTAKS